MTSVVVIYAIIIWTFSRVFLDNTVEKGCLEYSSIVANFEKKCVRVFFLILIVITEN